MSKFVHFDKSSSSKITKLFPLSETAKCVPPIMTSLFLYVPKIGIGSTTTLYSVNNDSNGIKWAECARRSKMAGF